MYVNAAGAGRGWYISCVFSRLFYISRPVLWINTVGPAVVGIWLAGYLWMWEALPILLWLTLPFNLLIYGTNDIFDQETDAKNPRKGSLEGARILPQEVRPIWAAVILTNIPFLAYFLLFLPASATLWMLLYAVLFVGYSAPPLRFKARPFLGLSLECPRTPSRWCSSRWRSRRGSCGPPPWGSWRGARPNTPSTPSRTSWKTGGPG